MPLTGLIDGHPTGSIPLDDRGLAYGDGLFETMRVARGRIPLLDGHLQRLARGGEALRLRIDLVTVERQIRELVAAMSSSGRQAFVSKLILTRGGGGQGYRSVEAGTCRTILLADELPQWPESHALDGVALYECRGRLGVNPALAGIKHLNRLEQVIARQEWQDDAFAEGLLCDIDGRVIECVASNLFLVKDGVLKTPRLHRCGVAGVMRAHLIARALSLGIGLYEGDVSREELDVADELFVCNSIRGIWPVRRLGERRYEIGSLTRRLQAEASRLWQD